jgi:hypothetical protein
MVETFVDGPGGGEVRKRKGRHPELGSSERKKDSED